MFLKPPSTQSERYKILQDLQENFLFPQEFGPSLTELQKEKVKKLIHLMLENEPQKRPTVNCLQKCELVPLISIEENDFQVN